MKSLWNDKEASEYKTDLDLRVYTSRLLGQDSSLVLHGGGNTSVKSTATNLFGETEDILYVKDNESTKQLSRSLYARRINDLYLI